jgi:hypothetical protein
VYEGAFVAGRTTPGHRQPDYFKKVHGIHPACLGAAGLLSKSKSFLFLLNGIPSESLILSSTGAF